MLPNWTVPNNYRLAEIEENVTVSLSLPLATTEGVTTAVISGELPRGLRLENNQILGTPFEVDRPILSAFVIRARTDTGIADRTFYILVDGEDGPTWLTPEGKLPIGPNNVLFILDNSLIDFQLLATDPDLPVGESLEYKLTGGELPPGITLTESGRLTGFVDPLLALEINVVDGSYDRNPIDSVPFDFDFGLDPNSRTPRKLNREYFFRVTVTDNVTAATRQFQILVVGDDFARADNTIMKAADGIFTADFTFLRVPLWLTPSDLGIKRANNYLTIFLDAFDSNTLVGELRYFLEPINDDGTASNVPPGLFLDSTTGELAGRVPYQPAVTRDYKFTVNAIRFNSELGVFTVFGTYLNDTLARKTSTLRIAKVPRAVLDGLSDLQRLIDRTVVIENQEYTVINVNESNPLYDTITLDRPLEPLSDIASLRSVKPITGPQSFFFTDELSQFDRNFYLNKTLRYSDTEQYEIADVAAYVEWEITSVSNDGISLISNNDSTLIEDDLQALFSTSERQAYIEVTRNSSDQVSSLKLIVPSTAANRNRSLIEGLFTTSDSVAISILNLGTYDRILLNQDIAGSLSNDLIMDIPINLGLVRNGFFSVTFSRLSEEAAFKKKTFTIRLLGEVDSVIAWLTPSNLGTLAANRFSTLAVAAQSTVTDAVIKYSITQGSLPPGLRLSQDGEIIGKVPVTGTEEVPGLIRFFGTDEEGERIGLTTFDFGATTFDREFKFTVLAKDRFEYSAIEREFVLTMSDEDNLNYSNIFIKPFLKSNQREKFATFVDNARIFTPNLIYRPSDPNFGIQKTLKCLVYAGIENLNLDEYVTATARNHKRKSFQLGRLKTAVAKRPGTNTVVYEVVYVELVDPSNTSQLTQSSIKIATKNKITADSVNYETSTDADSLNVDQDAIDRNLSPIRYRPNGNTIKSDTSAITVDQNNDNTRYISNIDNMRQNIKNIVTSDRRAVSNRDFLPLWMRTPQEGSLTELGYVLALPVAYTKPGQSQTIKENIENSQFDFKLIDFDIDRYIIDTTKDLNQEQYILFANYQFNV